ncbi:MAG TPA: hypothetical protein VFV34_06830 [Blastocatellia bacterium]|nr:hypothetical protein [Blastocatellia bacterium]
MKVNSSQARRSWQVILVITTALCCFAALKTAAGPSFSAEILQDSLQRRAAAIASLKAEDITVTNETSAFAVVAVEKTPEGFLRLALRNDYNKTITAYEFRVGITGTLVETFTNGIKVGIQPGESIEKLEAIDLDPGSDKLGVQIRAVIFEDGTGDGNARLVQEIRDVRTGEVIQLEHFTSSLRKFSSSAGVRDFSQLLKTKTLLNEEDAAYQTLPEATKSGMRNMRQVLSRYTDNAVNNAARSGQPDAAQIAGALLAHCEEQFAPLRSYARKVSGTVR